MDALSPQIPKGMRPGKRAFQSASITVSLCTAVPEHMRAGTREISHVFVPAEDRRKHLATALLNFVCQEADANRMTLILTASPYDRGGPSEDELKSWYEKFGFQQIQAGPDGPIMARRVRIAERPRLVPVAVHAALH